MPHPVYIPLVRNGHTATWRTQSGEPIVVAVAGVENEREENRGDGHIAEERGLRAVVHHAEMHRVICRSGEPVLRDIHGLADVGVHHGGPISDVPREGEHVRARSTRISKVSAMSPMMYGRTSTISGGPFRTTARAFASPPASRTPR